MKKILLSLISIVVLSLVFYFINFSFSAPAISPEVKDDTLSKKEVFTDIQNSSNFSDLDLSKEKVVEAKAYLVKDLTNNKTIFEYHADQSLSIASLTKLMTVWLCLKKGNLDYIYTIDSSNNVIQVSPSLGLKNNDQVIIKDLINSILIGSANDAASNVGNYLSSKNKENFVKEMNKEAETMGMKSTHYANPIGFDDDSNYSSAEDMSILSENLIKSYPEIIKFTSKAQDYNFTSKLGNEYQVKATNKLTKNYANLYAIKTGYTPEALGSMINIYEHNQNKYLIVVIGSNNREKATLLLTKQIDQLN